jgi:hypothetical protein
MLQRANTQGTVALLREMMGAGPVTARQADQTAIRGPKNFDTRLDWQRPRKAA